MQENFYKQNMKFNKIGAITFLKTETNSIFKLMLSTGKNRK